MRSPRTTSRLPVVVLALTLGLAGCGGGGEGDPSPGAGTTAATSRATTGASGAVGSFRTLANAVCRAEVSDVPRVPGAEDPPSAAPRYAAAIERAADGLADAFVVLERRRPESEDALAPLVTKARAVSRAARSATRDAAGASTGAAGVQDELRVTIAVLNEASSAAGLPTCAL